MSKRRRPAYGLELEEDIHDLQERCRFLEENQRALLTMIASLVGDVKTISAGTHTMVGHVDQLQKTIMRALDEKLLVVASKT